MRIGDNRIETKPHARGRIRLFHCEFAQTFPPGLTSQRIDSGKK
jgi:hypothetical protein